MHTYPRQMTKAIYVIVVCLALLTSYPVGAQDGDTNSPPPDLQAVAAPMPGVLQVQRRVTPSSNLKPGQDVTVAMQFSGKALPECWGAPGKPVDVVVLLDTSPSAGRPAPGSNLDRSQQILRSLWKQMDQSVYETIDRSSHSRLAIVTIDTGIKTAYEVTTRLALTDTSTAIEAAITGLQNGADSGFDDGVKQAAALLRDTARPDAARAIILLLHDNYFFDKEGVAIQAVKDAAKQAPVFVIGNWYNVRAIDRVTRDIATEAVGSAARVSINPSAQDLRRLFVLASGSTPSSLGKVLRTQETLNPLSAIEIRGSDVGNGGVLDGDKIIWKAPLSLTSAPAEVRYGFRVSSAVTSSLSMIMMLDFVDCNGFLQVGVNPLSTTPIPVAPTPVPSMTSGIGTPTSMPSITPGIGTPTLTPSITPTVTPTPGGIIIWGISCWPWPLLMLVLLLLLLPLLWLWWKSRQPSKKTSEEGAGTRNKRKDDQEEKKPWLPPTPPGDGRIIRPGPAPEDEKLQALLQKELAFKGRIRAGTTGYASSPAEARILKSAKDMELPSGWSLEQFGLKAEFLWQHDQAERRVPVAQLQRILSERIATEGPLLAVWTTNPADNATFVIKSTPNSDMKEERIRVTHVYRRPQERQLSQREKFYWLELKLLNKSDWNVSVSNPTATER